MLRFLCAILVVATCTVGCGRGNSDLPQTVPVKVTVRYQGEPVEKASVAFTSADQRGAVGNTDSKGETRLWTYEPGDGVIPGSYAVTIRKLEVLALPDPETVSPEEYTRLSRQMNSALSGSPKHLLPKHYSSAETSGLTAEVKADAENTFTFELEED